MVKLAFSHQPILFLKEKWKLVDRIKRGATEQSYKSRIHEALDDQVRNGVSAVMSFIDIDDVVGTKAIDAAYKVKHERMDIKFASDSKIGFSFKSKYG